LEEADADGVIEDGGLTIAGLTGVDVESTVGVSTEAVESVIEVAPALTGAELDTTEVSGFIASSPIDSPFSVWRLERKRCKSPVRGQMATSRSASDVSLAAA
jgi:hypothetical protein